MWFLSHHKILHEINIDIASGVTGKLERKVLVVTGIHRSNTVLLKFFSRLKIGIQTEQLYDYAQNKLWGHDVCKETILKNLKYYDVILDLSPTNKLFYLENNISLKKINFGPYIFPEIVPNFCPRPNGHSLFVGSLSCKKRIAKLDLLRKKIPKLKVLGEKSYGEKLEIEIMKSDSLVNINMGNNNYAPYPRILKSIIYGKALISETLPPPFSKNIHYIDIHKINKKKLEYTYLNMSKFLCSKYSFNKFIKMIVKE